MSGAAEASGSHAAAESSGLRSVAASGDVGMAVTGDNSVAVHVDQQVVLPLDPAIAAPSPPHLGNVPARLGFVGRHDELALLDRAMERERGVVIRALHGLGGIGKSALAAHWANRRADRFNPVWWIGAETRADVDAGLASLATALQPGLAGFLSQEALCERAVQWLASHDGWLVVLDSVSDPADVIWLLDRTSSGRFVITSRRATGWHGVAEPLALDVLEPADAVALFTRIATRRGDSGGTPDGAAALCEELGHLPLAVEQAAAYCVETGTTPAEYLDLLAGYPAEMYDDSGEGGDSSRTVARIWRVTLDRIADDAHAGTMLRVLAWYAPDGVPFSLLDALGPPPAVRRARGRLAAHSMVGLDAAARTVSVHRLVQAVARTADPRDPHRDAAAIEEARQIAVGHLVRAVPQAWADPACWPAWRELLPHIDALAEHAPPETDTVWSAWLFGMAGRFLLGQGAAGRAVERLARVLAAKRRLLGEDHPETLRTRYELAGAHQETGDTEQAVAQALETLDRCLRALGDEHIETYSAWSVLAHAYRVAGNARQAILAYQAALDARERVLGEDHQVTLSARNDLADAYRVLGDLDHAFPLCERTLERCRRSLGEDHPETLRAWHNLASACRADQQFRRAVELCERTLDQCRASLGDDHPSTLWAQNVLAGAYRAAGDAERAVALCLRTLGARERILGPDHPDTLVSRSNLAAAYESSGETDRAVELFAGVLADRTRILGTDHPDTARSRTNLDSARGRPRSTPGQTAEPA
ncbi:FxSxx-COOH system tetratricopeptide repeat protein [Streptomyces sp. NPDC002514]|uniref:FxSxx-COOH system tetratricopeptide repeat protein n=1 Tax=Streptomyces sp. NPDC001270 TaxID=3364554 RepID=UPI003689FCB5